MVVWMLNIGSVLADAPTNTGPEFGKASPLGLLIVIILLISVIILVRSMNTHLKRVPRSFDSDNDDNDEPRT